MKLAWKRKGNSRVSYRSNRIFSPMYFKYVQCLTKPITLLFLESLTQKFPHLPLCRQPSFRVKCEPTVVRALHPGDRLAVCSLLSHVPPCLPLNCEFFNSGHPMQCIPHCRNFINYY